jgi:hypothetical protein
MEKKFTQTIETIQTKLEKTHELIAIPIFRSNDLYNSLFPEITPIFKRGEEPSLKKIFDSIKEHGGKEVILDRTCYKAIAWTPAQEANIEDFPDEFKLKKIPENSGTIDMDKLTKLFKKNFDVTLSPYDNTIDSKIAKALGYNFSPDLIQSLFEIAKQKNSDIQKVYILSDNISDHVGDFPKDKVLDVLKEKVESEFGLSAIIVPTLCNIEKGDHVVFDRHNHLMSSLVDLDTYRLPENISHQVSLLPLETELHNNEQFGGKKLESGTLVETLRKSFEKVG